MAKIIGLKDFSVLIGTDSSGIREVMRDELNFEPHIGDEVEIFETDGTTIISRTAYSKDNSVNKVAYCLLALLLGGFGAHKFYSRKIGLGILYLVFCWTWIPSIVALIECIVALTKKADANGCISI